MPTPSEPNGYYCQKCGGPLSGLARKWCSERCRKSQYDKQCRDCGARISGTDPGKSLGRCVKCSNRITSNAKWDGHRELIETLWSAGYMAKQIAELLGYKAMNIPRLRSLGYNLPHRLPPERARHVGIAGTENLRKARAAKGVGRA